MSGPLLTRDGKTIVGSLYLVEVEDRTNIDSLPDQDPLTNAELSDRIDINRFHRRVG